MLQPNSEASPSGDQAKTRSLLRDQIPSSQIWQRCESYLRTRKRTCVNTFSHRSSVRVPLSAALGVVPFAASPAHTNARTAGKETVKKILQSNKAGCS